MKVVILIVFYGSAFLVGICGGHAITQRMDDKPMSLWPVIAGCVFAVISYSASRYFW